MQGSNLFLMQKESFKHFSRGLQGVGDLLFFIKHGIYRAVYMHFSNNCMHAPYTVLWFTVTPSRVFDWIFGILKVVVEA